MTRNELLTNIWLGLKADLSALSDGAKRSLLSPNDTPNLVMPLEDVCSEIEVLLANTYHGTKYGPWAAGHVGVVLAAAMCDGLTADLFPQAKLWDRCGVTKGSADDGMSARKAGIAIQQRFPNRETLTAKEVQSLADEFNFQFRGTESVYPRYLVISMMRTSGYSGFLRSIFTAAGGIFASKCCGQYGELYQKRLRFEDSQNQRGINKKQAAAILAQRHVRATDRPYYERGLLPPSQLDMRARRFATKAFFEHFVFMRREENGDSIPEGWTLLENLPEEQWGKKEEVTNA